MPKKYYPFIKHVFFVLRTNPSFFVRRVFLELKQLISVRPKNCVSKKINGVLFKFDFDYSPSFKSMYYGTYEPSIVELLKKHLKNGDTFIDAGANIGYYTAIAAGLVGKDGQVHSFEPVPEYFQKLRNIAEDNKQCKITVNKLALGDEEKTKKIYIGGHQYIGKDIGNNTFFPDLFDNLNGVSNTDVSVCILDKYIKQKNIKNIKLIKIDVEGFEFSVLRGLKDYLSQCFRADSGPLIICEIIPEVYPSLGYKVEDLFKYMADFSYYPFEIINTHKKANINRIKKKHDTDVLFKFCQ